MHELENQIATEIINESVNCGIRYALYRLSGCRGEFFLFVVENELLQEIELISATSMEAERLFELISEGLLYPEQLCDVADDHRQKNKALKY